MSNEEKKKIEEEKLENASGGVNNIFFKDNETCGGDEYGRWSLIPGCGDCHVKCYNPECKHYGHYVSAAIGPENCLFCDFCNNLITNSYGVPIHIK